MGGAGISVPLSQGHPSPPVAAAICSMGGTNAAGDITSSGAHSFLFLEAPPSSSQSVSSLKLESHDLIS